MLLGEYPPADAVIVTQPVGTAETLKTPVELATPSAHWVTAACELAGQISRAAKGIGSDPPTTVTLPTTLAIAVRLIILV